MQNLTKSRHKSTFLVSTLLGGVIFTGCAAGQITNSSPSQVGSESKSVVSGQNQQQTPRQSPQLIKKATLDITVNSIDDSVKTVSQIIKKQRGDLIKLNERQPSRYDSRHTVDIEMRVPQNLLEATLEELTKLGTLNNRNITAEDVSDQIVDFQARLSNLRKTEASLQTIMDRSGSMSDVLSVAQELSNVRESIERIDAQLRSLQNQVAYSTITLYLEASVTTSSPQTNLGTQIQDAWNASTNSIGEFTVGLLKLLIWLLVYSPYLLILVVGSYSFYRWRRNQKLRLAKLAESKNSD